MEKLTTKLKEYINEKKVLEYLTLNTEDEKDAVNYIIRFKLKGDDRIAGCNIKLNKYLNNLNDTDIILFEFKRGFNEFLV